MKGRLIFRAEDDGNITVIEEDHEGQIVREEPIAEAAKRKNIPTPIGSLNATIAKAPARTTTWFGIFMGFGLTMLAIALITVSELPIFAVIGGVWFGWRMPRYIQRFIDR